MNQRMPVAISLNQGTIVTTGGSATFDPGNEQDAMKNYLRLVRRMRHQRRAPSVHLRQRDVDAMAIDLRMPADAVTMQLNELMEATRASMPAIGGGVAVVLAASAAVAVGMGARTYAGRSSDTPSRTNANQTSNANVPPAEALEPSTGIFIGPDGAEVPVSLGGAPAPPPPP